MKKGPTIFYHGPEEGKSVPVILKKTPHNIFYRGSGKTGAAYDPKKHHTSVNFYYHPEENEENTSSIVH